MVCITTCDFPVSAADTSVVKLSPMSQPVVSVELERALLSLDGLAIGDALGEMLAYRYDEAAQRIQDDSMPAGPWFHTDDTEMAIAVVETLRLARGIDQDTLAFYFGRRFDADPDRGYGKMTRMQLRSVLEGKPWRTASSSAFSGRGSMGNGSAMRVAPLGGYFAEDLLRVCTEARLSSEVTHMHPEGIAGAIAVAVAAAMAWQTREMNAEKRWDALFQAVINHTPPGEVQRGLEKAVPLAGASVEDAARALGNGALITAPDSVPFAVWCAATHLQDFPGAISAAISGGGDCDTIAAMAGGIVALSTGREGIPTRWLHERERLPFDR
jgi:ADP-ribosylglycohydrolase